jgi:hypothetical protein
MTNKIVLRSSEEFMADFQPTYAPIFSLFLEKSQAYPEEVGELTFKRLDTVGDIRMKAITPKDTEIKQVVAKIGSKVFKKEFFANQYVQSNLQSREGNEDVVKQVIDENLKLADDLLLLGQGTAGNNVVNNGLFWSGDANYVLETSIEIDNANAWLTDLHAQIITAKIKADLVSGRKVVIFYGALMLPKINGLYAASGRSFKAALSEVLNIGGQNYSIAELPADVTPSGANGWMIVNRDQVKLHYMTLPKLAAQGINEEKMYSWHNFLAGTMMLEVLVSKAIIRQPVTFEAAA